MKEAATASLLQTDGVEARHGHRVAPTAPGVQPARPDACCLLLGPCVRAHGAIVAYRDQRRCLSVPRDVRGTVHSSMSCSWSWTYLRHA